MRFGIAAIALCVLLYPTYAVQSYPHRLGYVTPEEPELYQFLQQQPEDTLVASLSSAADFIPSLAQRSVLVAREYSIPYHWDYYRQIRQRTIDLILAQYNSERSAIEQTLLKYPIDLWLVDKNAFKLRYLRENSWLRQFQSETDSSISAFIRGNLPFIATKIKKCSIFETRNLALLEAKCLLNSTD